MKSKGDILFINDDIDDKFIYESCFEELGFLNKIVFIDNAQNALEYLKKTKPFIIFCDVNLPRVNGFELRKQITDNELINQNAFPFLFFTSNVSDYDRKKAYAMNVQGFFAKDFDFHEQKNTFKIIMEYWQESHTPPV